MCEWATTKRRVTNNDDQLVVLGNQVVQFQQIQSTIHAIENSVFQVEEIFVKKKES